MDLELEDVASLLTIPEATISDWAKEGSIPGYRIGGKWLFSRSEIQDWVLHRQTGNKQPLPFSNSEDSQQSRGIHHFSLYRALHHGDVLHQMQGATKEELIANSMKIIAPELDLDAEVLTDLLLDRERLMPTALNSGIAVPHTRDFLLEQYDAVILVFPEEPVDYGALDGKPVDMLFFLFACEDKRHLNLLAKIAHLASQAQELEFLRGQPCKKSLLEHMKIWESSLIKN